jgi:hypothetical protein
LGWKNVPNLFKKWQARVIENTWETVENEIKDLDLVKAYKHLGVEENHNVERKNEKERLKEEYIRRLKLIQKTELNKKIKCKQVDHWQCQY